MYGNLSLTVTVAYLSNYKVLYGRNCFSFEGKILIDFFNENCAREFLCIAICVLCPTCDKDVTPKRFFFNPLNRSSSFVSHWVRRVRKFEMPFRSYRSNPLAYIFS